MAEPTYELFGRKVLMRVTALPCRSAQELMRSPLVRRVVEAFVEELTRRGSPLLTLVRRAERRAARPADDQGAFSPAATAQRLTDALRILAESPWATASEMAPHLAPVLSERRLLIEFVERLYDFWRSRERYLIVETSAESSRDRALEGHTSFIEANEQLRGLVLEAYRRIASNLEGHWPRVYRQVPAGANMSLLVERISWPCPAGPYDFLRAIKMVRLALIEPPVVLYPRRTFRKGRFVGVAENPLRDMALDPDDWFCMPVKVGPAVIFVFFHKDYLALGTSLVNLFELADHAEARRRPDGVLVFGVPPEALGDQPNVFFEDEAANLAVGAVARTEDMDYFGYFKKMTLTLHNLIVMRRGRLPFHGAMCRVELKSGRAANVVIVGDSGTGKSESLEAFRVLADEHLRAFSIIADDMGSLELVDDGRIRGYGTEIGAFVRLDDLQPGYAFGQIDRSIFMNPHRTNARLVIPVTSFAEVSAGYPIDFFLYANNYEQCDEDHAALQFFDSPDDARHVFREGYRVAKGTSDEKGLVHTYFGNPFGPAQRRDLHDQRAREYLEAMFRAGVKVGQLRTRLGIPGLEQEGPEAAARALFDAIAAD